MPSIFEDIKKEQTAGQSIFQQKEPMGKSIFVGAETTPVATAEPVVGYSQKELSRRVIPQLLTGIAEEVPFGRRFNLPVPIEQVPTPVNLPAKVARAGGRLLGMFPSFAIGGLGGGAVAKGVTGKLVTKLPRLAKYIGTGAGGATTFTGARALRNIGQNQPFIQGLPEEAIMGTVFGPTGLIRSLPKAIATSAGLGAIIAPE